jgi:tetratricopeptide (TPR) repeat protein
VISASLAIARRDLRAALAELEYACTVDPKQPGALSLLGEVQLRVGRRDAAERLFRRALEQNAGDAASMDGLAAVALHRKDYAEAAHWGLEALARDIRLPRAHYHLGIALTRLQQPDAAAEAFAASAKLDPLRAAPLYWQSRLAGERGDAAAAADFRERARDIRRRRRQRQVIN